MLGHVGKSILLKVVGKYPMLQWRYACVMTFFMDRSISQSKISRTLSELGLTRKTSTPIYSESLTDEIYKTQQKFMRRMDERIRKDPDYLNKAYFVDVVSFNQKGMHARKGYTPRGQAFYDALPSDRASTSTFGPHLDACSAVNRKHGVVGLAVYEGHTTAAIALNYFLYVLLPLLKAGDDDRPRSTAEPGAARRAGMSKACG